jgi:alcohol dehydrogenase class IV
MQFEFSTPSRILFGNGSLNHLGEIAVSYGKCALLATNLPEVNAKEIVRKLTDQGVAVIQFRVTGEPELGQISEGVNLARQNGCELVIGLGGGSAIDSGKAIAGLITNKGEISKYLEVIGKGLPLTEIPLPMIAIPTTAGTGAEVTWNAVLSSPEHRVKVSMRSRMLLPRIALIDPVLTYGLPPYITASTGLDALTQLIEPFVSLRANPFTDALCRDGITRVAYSLRKAYHENSLDAREGMSLASLFGGMALANSGLGAVHGFAGVLGGMYAAPHGIICARLLPHVIQKNVQAIQNRMPDSPTQSRFDEIARLLTGQPQAKAADSIQWVDELCSELRIAPLSRYGLARNDFNEIVEKTMKASSTKANPIQLTRTELTEILEKEI